jgi:hypothetical protein
MSLQRGFIIYAEDQTHMFAENTHLELMTKEQPVLRTWRSLSVFILPVPVFDSPTQKRVLDFVTQSPETFVRQAEVRFFAGNGRFFADFLIEGSESEEAIGNSVLATLGGLMCADLEPQQIDLYDMHIAPLAELQKNTALRVVDKPYDVRDRALASFRSAQAFYLDAA